MARYFWNRYKVKAKYTFNETFQEYMNVGFVYGYTTNNVDDTRPPFTNPKYEQNPVLREVMLGADGTNNGEFVFVFNKPVSDFVYKYVASGGSHFAIYRQTVSSTTYSPGEYLTTITADENAYINNARNADGYWYVRGEKANTAPNYTQIPTQSTKKDLTVTINLANFFIDSEGDPLTYAASSSNPSVATTSVVGNTLTLTGKEIGSAWISVDANDGEFTTSQGFTLNVTNTAPTVSVTSPSANVTLYENDIFNIAGSAADVNANQSVTVYGQVNLESKFVMGIGLSNAPIAFSKQLKFKGGRLFDGDIGVTRNLTDGVPHTLKIWAQDSDGGQSTIVERAFYVVPNRPPILTVDAVQPSGIINTDKFAISGTASDPDDNDMTASYRLNGNNSVALEIIEGKWAFDIALSQLVVGQNTIVIELMDSYDFKVSKTIKLNKNEVKTPILQSVARYKISPPKGSAKGVLLWIQRDGALDLTVDLSMTLKGEQESYVPLTATHTVPVYESVVEDEFYYETQEPKDNIILKLTTTRANINVNNKIYLIMGVLE